MSFLCYRWKTYRSRVVVSKVIQPFWKGVTARPWDYTLHSFHRAKRTLLYTEECSFYNVARSPACPCSIWSTHPAPVCWSQKKPLGKVCVVGLTIIDSGFICSYCAPNIHPAAFKDELTSYTEHLCFCLLTSEKSKWVKEGKLWKIGG